jgi:hypothetical protein
VAERREELRAADSDRQFVAERLQAALNEGRLNLSEYDERLAKAYASRTYGELDSLLDDLPASITGRDSVVPAQPAPAATPAAPSQQPVAPAARVPHWLEAIWGGWLTASVICVMIWLLSGRGDFWPVWVIVPWGVLLLLRTVSGFAGGEQVRQQYRQERWQRRQARRARRWG